MARVNPQYIVADMVDATSFPSLSDRFEITGVPATIINGRGQQVGAAPESQLAEAIRKELNV